MNCTVRSEEQVASVPAFEPAVCAATSQEELYRFAVLQARLAPMFRRVFSDPSAPRTVVVVPSMTLDRQELVNLVGAPFYEERLLCLLFFLRLPATRVVYVTSQPVAPTIVDYYLGLLPADVRAHARRRLTMLSCHDGSSVPLTEKILNCPELLGRMRAAVDDPAAAHVTCFNATALERTLAVRLGLPLYACDPALGTLGTKSGSRDVFREAGVDTPPGYGHLRGDDDIVGALSALRHEYPRIDCAVVKLDEGFSGEGNAIFSYDGAPAGQSLAGWVRAELPHRLRFVAPGETWEPYRAKFARMGGIVEAMVQGAEVRSPSVQVRIDPVGRTHIISTHDQTLGGETGQVYLGCTFPAEAGGREAMHNAARLVADVLARRGVVGRFGIDFVVTRDDRDWTCHAIEINVRKGGTTHPFLALELLTDGTYDATTGQFHTAKGRLCHYVASDNINHPAYANLDPSTVIEASRSEGLPFDLEAERGVVFHMLGALSTHGKLGATAVGRTPEDAQAIFRRVITLLDRESGRATGEAMARWLYEAARADGRQRGQAEAGFR